MRKILFILFTLLVTSVNAQELNATVEFNTNQIAATNQQVFKTLKIAITDFLNNTKWTDRNYKPQEKIICNFVFNISNFDNVNKFSGTLQVSSIRPVYNTIYTTPVLNINDKEVNFEYTEYQNLNFSPTTYESNLISILAFYANIIIGFDADTFSIEGGTKAYENAMNIVSFSQANQDKTWSPAGNNNKYHLVNDILSATYTPYRKALYHYHLGGLDVMEQQSKNGKMAIIKAIENLKEVAAVRPNAFLTRVFFDAKTDEITAIFSAGPKLDTNQLIANLNTLSPLNSSKWIQISF